MSDASTRKGDGVRDYEYLGMAKVVNYLDEQVQMLHKVYAQQLLTHRNPYTGAAYRHEPAVAIWSWSMRIPSSRRGSATGCSARTPSGTPAPGPTSPPGTPKSSRPNTTSG